MRGDLRVADAPLKARWDWGWLQGCFGSTKISASDIDAIWERHGHFLLFEVKRPDEALPAGQLLLLRALSAFGVTEVYLVRGERNDPQTVQKITPGGLGELQYASKDGIRAIVAAWFAHADAQDR
jgi:hypothetical protein